MNTAIDVGVVIFILISAILAAARGFTREVLALATWAGSAIVAVYLFIQTPERLAEAGGKPNLLEEASKWLHEQSRAMLKSLDPTIVAIILGAVVFLVMLIILHLLTMWIADLVVDSRIGPLDRTLGFVFGLARGVVVGMVAAVFAGYLWAPPAKDGPLTYRPLYDLGNLLTPTELSNWLSSYFAKRDAPDQETQTVTDAPSGTEG